MVPAPWSQTSGVQDSRNNCLSWISPWFVARCHSSRTEDAPTVTHLTRLHTKLSLASPVPMGPRSKHVGLPQGSGGPKQLAWGTYSARKSLSSPRSLDRAPHVSWVSLAPLTCGPFQTAGDFSPRDTCGCEQSISGGSEAGAPGVSREGGGWAFLRFSKQRGPGPDNRPLCLWDPQSPRVSGQFSPRCCARCLDAATGRRRGHWSRFASAAWGGESREACRFRNCPGQCPGAGPGEARGLSPAAQSFASRGRAVWLTSPLQTFSRAPALLSRAAAWGRLVIPTCGQSLCLCPLALAPLLSPKSPFMGRGWAVSPSPSAGLDGFRSPWLLLGSCSAFCLGRPACAGWEPLQS